MGNTNNISAFEKIVFVDKINNEYDAEQLSKDYPFAFILTDETPEGLENGILYEDDHLIDHEEQNGVVIKENKSSGNIWKAGKRLTKFVNVDKERNVAQFDAYDLKLDFDKTSGLLSFQKIPKIEGFRLVSLFYKEKDTSSTDNNAYKIKVYVDKERILSDFDNGNESYIINNDIGVSNITDMNNLLNNFHNLKDISTSDIENLYDIYEDDNNKGFINSIDNKFYIVLRFEATSESTLNTVSAESFNIVQNNGIIDINVNASIFNIKQNLKDFLNITDNSFETDLDNLCKVTCKYKYQSSAYGFERNGYIYRPGRYIIYELELKSINNDYGTYNFSMTNTVTLPALGIGINKLFVNPTSYKLFINENEVDFNSTDISAYIMPGSTVRCRYEVYPNKISDLSLTLSLNNNNFKFKTSNSYEDSIVITNSTDMMGNNNKFLFEIAATDSYDLYNGETNYLQNITSTIGLNLVKENEIIWQNNTTKIRKYVWLSWKYKRIDNGESPYGNIGTGIAESGLKSNFNTGRIYCVFNIDTDSTEDTEQLLEITNNVSVGFVFNPGIASNNVDNNNGGLAVSNVPCNTPIQITVPFIFKAHENANFYATYTHKGHTVNGDIITIIPDRIRTISITNGITFNDINNSAVVSDVESGATVEIKRNRNDNEGKFIEFEYNNGQVINAYKYLYSTLEEFKRDIRIALRDNLETEFEQHDKTNVVGVPYIQIQNNKLIYNSDDARNNPNIINLRIEYSDPNYDNAIAKSNIISLTVRKLVIDWWIYLGEIHTVHYNNLEEADHIEFKLPDIPNNTTLAAPHFINSRIDQNDPILGGAELYCGKLYEYNNINNPSADNYNYIENTQNPTRERSFGTWIHLGTEEYMKSQLNLCGHDSNKLYDLDFIDGKQVTIFAGNKDWTIIMLPDFLDIKDITGNKLPWPTSLPERDNYIKIYNKGIYNAYILRQDIANYQTGNEEYTYGLGLAYGLYYNR